MSSDDRSVRKLWRVWKVRKVRKVREVRRVRKVRKVRKQPSGRRERGRASFCAALSALVLAFVASPSVADPELVVVQTALGEGLVGFDVFIEFDDQLLRSATVEAMTFIGNFRHIEPDGGIVDSDTTGQFIIENFPELNYDPLRDSYFILSQFPDHTDPTGGEIGSTEYVLAFGGTGVLSEVDKVHVAYLVLAYGEGFTYSGLAGRESDEFLLVPEPSLGACITATWLALAALHRAALHRRKRRSCRSYSAASSAS